MPKKKSPDIEYIEFISDEATKLIVQKNGFEYFASLKDMRLTPVAPHKTIGEIDEIELKDITVALLREIDRFSYSNPSPNACYFWLECVDVTEIIGGCYVDLIATVRLYNIKGVPIGPTAIFQRLFAFRTDMTDVSTYAPIEIYMRVVEDFYQENGYSLTRGENSFTITPGKGHQGAIISWLTGIKKPPSEPAILVLNEQIHIIEEIEKRYASRMAYTDVSQLDEANPWIAIMENMKSMNNKLEDALSKNKTTIYGDIKISKGDFVGGDKVTNIQNEANIFSDILATVDEKENISKADKVALKSEITELGVAVQKTQPDEGFIKKRLQNVKKMAPDIFAVTLSTLLNPISGLSTAVTKIAEKMKAEKSSS